MENDKLESTEPTDDLNELEKQIVAENEKPSVEEVKEESVEETKEETTEEVKEETKEETTQSQDDSAKQSEPEIPEKYRGKSADEIIKMHQEAEKLMHSSSQESARYRKLLADKVDFDDDGHIVGIKQPTNSQPQQQQSGEDFWSAIEQATNLPRQTLQPLMSLWESRNQTQMKQIKNQFEEELKPLRRTQHESRYERLKAEMKKDPQYKHLGDVEADMDEFIKERKIPYESIRDANSVATLYYTSLGKRFDKKVEKKKAETSELNKVSEQEKTEAQVSTSTKAITEGKKDIATMSVEELEKLLPQQEL